MFVYLILASIYIVSILIFTQIIYFSVIYCASIKLSSSGVGLLSQRHVSKNSSSPGSESHVIDRDTPLFQENSTLELLFSFIFNLEMHSHSFSPFLIGFFFSPSSAWAFILYFYSFFCPIRPTKAAVMAFVSTSVSLISFISSFFPLCSCYIYIHHFGFHCVSQWPPFPSLALSLFSVSAFFIDSAKCPKICLA